MISSRKLKHLNVSLYFQILNAPEDFSLYKILQTGEKRELDGLEMPLIQRLRMGPFDEDKIFIMEKGTEVNISIELENFMRLSLNLLNGLIENLKQQEEKDLQVIQKRYFLYKEYLIQRLNNII